MTDHNFYAELGVDQSSDIDTLTAKIKEQRRRYRQLTGSPQPEQRRLAESKIEMLAAAEEAFATPESRAAYDAQLASQPVQQEAAPAVSTGSNWFATAQEYLASGNAESALYAVREALRTDDSSPEVWKLQANIAMEIDDLKLANFSASEAKRRGANDPWTWAIMGAVLDRQGNYQGAQKEFSQAASIDPDNAYFQGRVVWTYADLNQLPTALSEGRALWQRFPNDDYAKSVYAYMLLRDVHASMSTNGSHSFITNPKQIAHVEERLAEVAMIGSQRDDIIADYHEYLALAERAKKRQFKKPTGFMILSIIGHVLIGAWILLWILTSIFGSDLGVVIWLLANAGLAFVAFQKMYPVAWKNTRALAGNAARTGLQ